ncbi:uncharacterized protein BDR25DRAFT_302243 [Lindgomyces ingoldianus]|uniref:Uncharacterized protein n=1 Tax=Lindgomyces ingoldianus TaxID=673940 RepID=A0ACB6R217_9PLEO|nr:uncharacterized protein BDR25DRAFT_302243 [Lindgomyces ingoldianus]KAF2473289.1 hypothetical protein BDR25DRAFT_302243 [Lindgomyces ingoldianus]
MGRTAVPAPAASYRDDPDAVSMHTTPEDYTYDDAPEISGLPPSYADSESSPAAPILRHIPPPSNRRNHNNVLVMSGGKVQVCETQTLMDARYDTDPEYLEEGIRSFSQQAPIPFVYIMGTHKETTRRGDKKETKEVTDFRIVMSMQSYLRNNFDERDTSSMSLQTVENGEKVHRGTFMKKRAPGFKRDLEIGIPKPELKEWCHRYCASPSMLRIFRLRREITGFDETFLKSRLEGLIRSTNYRGHIKISFPIEDKNVDIYTTNRINEWRLKKWICWIFYLTFLWIFTWPYLFFATKRYAIVKAEWPFSKTDEYGNKKYTTISEEQWFEKWHVGIRRLALDRFDGETSEQQLAGVIARPEDPPMPGNIRTGHTGVDNAVGLLTQGFQVASAISRGDNLSRGLQGGWGYDN